MLISFMEIRVIQVVVLVFIRNLNGKPKKSLQKNQIKFVKNNLVHEMTSLSACDYLVTQIVLENV